ncbi:hypothetical protein COLO4_04400 [Corchorus olitorius]|uniref:Uncharacterized protein n=1 Tax=Corchorus olitorius TaxID=93759 RepID=A0A1R3KU92_9ROSI|nr:hypothetical protein COLO4_04400 [Corchorus olitorius]
MEKLPLYVHMPCISSSTATLTSSIGIGAYELHAAS